MSSIASHDSRSASVHPAPGTGAVCRRSTPFLSMRSTLAEAHAILSPSGAHHYENFSVATWFLPEATAPAFLQCLCLLPHFRRSGRRSRRSAGVALRLLDQWEAELDACYAGNPRHPVFVALAETVRRFEIPKQSSWIC